MSAEFSGEIIHIGDTQQIKDTFKKRTFVVKSHMAEYPQEVPFEVVQDKTTLLDGYKVGDTVTVKYELRGRGYTDKNGKPAWFGSINAWRIDKGGMHSPAKVQTSDLPADELPF